jgi:hypothetical protein
LSYKQALSNRNKIVQHSYNNPHLKSSLANTLKRLKGHCCYLLYPKLLSKAEIEERRRKRYKFRHFQNTNSTMYLSRLAFTTITIMTLTAHASRVLVPKAGATTECTKQWKDVEEVDGYLAMLDKDGLEHLEIEMENCGSITVSRGSLEFTRSLFATT